MKKIKIIIKNIFSLNFNGRIKFKKKEFKYIFSDEFILKTSIKEVVKKDFLIAAKKDILTLFLYKALFTIAQKFWCWCKLWNLQLD